MALYTKPKAPLPIGYNKVKRSSGLLGIDNISQSPACALVVNAVRSRTANLRDCPKLADHLANCRDMRREPWGYRFTADAHGQGSDRIDAAIAAAMAMWMTEVMPERVESFAESGGIWTL